MVRRLAFEAGSAASIGAAARALNQEAEVRIVVAIAYAANGDLPALLAAADERQMISPSFAWIFPDQVTAR